MYFTFEFEFLNGERAGERVSVLKRAVMGRTSECDIKVPDTDAGHVAVLLEADLRNIYASDLVSTKGIFINNRRISVSVSVLLQDGDILSLGLIRLLFRKSKVRETPTVSKPIEVAMFMARPSNRNMEEDASNMEEDASVVYPVWFGTNRQRANFGFSFSNERCDVTTLGRVLVRIPRAHRFGETGDGFWKRLLRFSLRDDRLLIQQIDHTSQEAFYSEVRHTMKSAIEAGDSPQALVFLHGFNVSFEEAAIRAAQIGFDLKVPGACAFFSWPSRGNVVAYPTDEATIEASEQAITDFLVGFSANCGASKVHIIAHSMGNRGLLRSLQRISGNIETRGRVKFGQIFLAAPDVDRDHFLNLADLFPEHSDRTTLYTSDGDFAVQLSAILHDAPRAGYFKPYTVAPGVDTVAVPDFNIDALGHSYFAQAHALLHDIYDLMRHGDPPNKRQRLYEVVYDGVKVWELSR